MADLDFPQAEADRLLAIAKERIDDAHHVYPGSGGGLRLPLQSADGRESFTLDVTRNAINLLKGTYQTRGRSIIVLARLDFGGAPHRNPDDLEIQCPHIHLYREGYGDKWAFPIDPRVFHRPDDMLGTLDDFMRFCNIVRPPFIDGNLL